MYQFIYFCIDLVGPLILLPPAVMFYGRKRPLSKWNTAVRLVLTMYIAVLYHVTGLPDVYYHFWDPRLCMAAIVGIADDVLNSILNVILFLPLGFLLPTMSDRFRALWKTLLFGAAVSLLIEGMQLFTFRITDINDLFTNTAGTALGFLAAKRTAGWTGKYVKPMPDAKDILFSCGLAFSVMFFVQPFIFTILWEHIMG